MADIAKCHAETFVSIADEVQRIFKICNTEIVKQSLIIKISISYFNTGSMKF